MRFVRFTWQGFAIAALVGVVACGKRSLDPHRLATRAECAAYAAKVRSLMSPEQRETLRQVDIDGSDLALCQQRISSEMVACVEKASTLADALACKPSVEIRPPSAQRSPEECARYVEQVRHIVRTVKSGTPRIVETLAQSAERECQGYLSSERYRCTLAADDAHGWAACPP